MFSASFHVKELSGTHHLILSTVKLCTCFLGFLNFFFKDVKFILFLNVRVLYVLLAVSNVEWSFISAVGKS